MGQPTDTTLAEIYRRESRSFLQYVEQGSPYAGPAEKPVLERIRELVRTESATLTDFAEFLDKSRISIPHFGAFPTVFTNYNFVDVKKLVKPLVAEQAKELGELERDAAILPAGEGKAWVERLAASKRMHLSELEKMAA